MTEQGLYKRIFLLEHEHKELKEALAKLDEADAFIIEAHKTDVGREKLHEHYSYRYLLMDRIVQVTRVLMNGQL